MANGEPKHHYTVPWVIFAVVVAICIVAFLYWKYQIPEDRERAQQQLQTEQEAVSAFEAQSVVGDAIENVTEAVGGSPELNPVDKANPFTDIITNPFDL
ncbi:hypothetical protein CL629_00915 [bacterium]|nr:hypothetical protein [bacterium]|tara:strand:+ start:239 stop:535 length:297 start_codon:yes stop_codon:yes gene_type:complete